MAQGFDFVVVGGGTAGCVLAARLSRDPSIRVLLLEAGGEKPPGNPLDYAGMWDTGVDWAFRSTPQAGLGGVVIPVPRGRVLGGCSAINAMMHVRAHRSSYDAWERAGATGWNFDSLLPFLKHSEHACGADPALRGTDGPMVVAPGPAAGPGSFYHAAYRAAAESGASVTADGEGIARTEMNIVNFARQSAADAYLGPARIRPNLTVITEALVQRLLLDGRRCTGVEFVVGGRRRTAHATREVVLAAGAIGSPHLLMVSGIGPAAHLRSAGVDVVRNLPGVGENLQDHPLAHVTFATDEPIDAGGLPDIPHVVMRSDASADPNLQFMYVRHPMPHRNPGAGIEPWGSSAWHPERLNGYSVLFSLLRPYSRGSVTVADPRASTAPLIDLGYYTDPRDLDLMLVGLRRARQLGAAQALGPWRTGESAPGVHATGDEALREYIKLATGSYFHLAGTCAIGTGENAVVDPDLRVRGIGSLRVADASVMPSIVAANPDSTVLAIAERAASMLTPHAAFSSDGTARRPRTAQT